MNAANRARQALDKYHERLLTISPELEIETVEVNVEGLVNDVIIVNGEWVFRFAKDDWAVRALERELQILNLVRPHLSLSIPQPFYTSGDAIAYRRVPGETLTRELLNDLSKRDRRTIAGQLGDFLRELNQVPVTEGLPATSAPVRYQDWIEIRRKAEQKVYPLLMRHQIQWAERLFDGILDNADNFAYRPQLIHGDLGCYHILCVPQSGRLGGVIDFGVAGVGDPANDLANLIQYYGETFVQQVVKAYPQAEEFLPRARFYAQALELQWALNGLDGGATYWFTAHLGGARDIRSESGPC